MAALLYRAQRLLLERGDAAGDVAGRGVLGDRFAMVGEIALEAVHQADDFAKHARVGGAVHQQLLGAENLRNLGEDRGAARFGHDVAHPPDQRIGGEAGKAVRTAAFDAEHQLGKRRRLALRQAGGLDQRVDQRQPFLDFVLRFLRAERSDIGGRIDLGQQRLHLVGFATQPDDQHAAGIGMAGQRGEDGARAGKVVAQLRAAERMDEGVNAVDAAGMAARGPLGDLLGGAGDTSDGREDPDFVARADAAVHAAIAFEVCFTAGADGMGMRAVEILAGALQRGREILAVDVFARRDRALGSANRKAEFQHRLAGGNRCQRHLVAALYRLRDGNAERVLPGGEVAQGGSDAVAWIDLEEGRKHGPLIGRSDAHHT
jgi:hypothetical protein